MSVHDLGGTEGWGRLHPPERGEPVFAEPWQGRAFALGLLAIPISGTNIDAARHATNRLSRHEYFADGYWGRWLRAGETLLHDSAIIAPGAVEARAAGVAEPPPPTPNKPGYTPGGEGSIRQVDTPPRFNVHDRVRARTFEPRGATRLPRYAMGHLGTVAIVEPPHVFPDTNAHFQGEHPQWVYTVRFDSRELFGAESERFHVNVDLFESYLEAA
ncbi:nitrile hydratase subunit beta [Dactylosporangium sp. CS-033363]|uniref:nitrile hydratase subunit beta n=1 Tax=Dactylosporangium sp. CS-033363 TaxID=3239935 RepID=UPI003D8C4723